MIAYIFCKSDKNQALVKLMVWIQKIPSHRLVMIASTVDSRLKLSCGCCVETQLFTLLAFNDFFLTRNKVMVFNKQSKL